MRHYKIIFAYTISNNLNQYKDNEESNFKFKRAVGVIRMGRSGRCGWS